MTRQSPMLRPTKESDPMTTDAARLIRSLLDHAEIRALAESIAARLFTNGNNDRADRLVLELAGKRDGGGWCERAAVDQIERILEGCEDV